MRGTATTKDLAPAIPDRGRSRLAHVHHGRTPAAWIGTIGTSIGFLVGSVALVFPNWPVFFVGCGIVALALIATLVTRALGFGAD